MVSGSIRFREIKNAIKMQILPLLMGLKAILTLKKSNGKSGQKVWVLLTLYTHDTHTRTYRGTCMENGLSGAKIYSQNNPLVGGGDTDK